MESVAAMHPYYVARALGGLFIITGALMMAYNSYRTITTPNESALWAGRRFAGALAAGE